MNKLSNAELHRVQGRIRNVDRMIDAMIRGIQNRPQSWTAQDCVLMLEESAQDMLEFMSKAHEIHIHRLTTEGDLYWEVSA